MEDGKGGREEKRKRIGNRDRTYIEEGASMVTVSPEKAFRLWFVFTVWYIDFKPRGLCVGERERYTLGDGRVGGQWGECRGQ